MSPNSTGERPSGVQASREQSFISTALQLSLLISFMTVCFFPTATKAREGAAETAREGAAQTLWGADAPGGGEAARRARAGTAGTWEPYRWPRVNTSTSRLWAVGHLLLGLLVLSRFLLLLQQLFSPIQEVKCTTLAKPAHSTWLPPQVKVPWHLYFVLLLAQGTGSESSTGAWLMSQVLFFHPFRRAFLLTLLWSPWLWAIHAGPFSLC